MLPASGNAADALFPPFQECVMDRIVFAALSLLAARQVLADEAPAVAAAPLDADPTGLIVFALVFVGMIGGFAYYIWSQERKKAQPRK